MWDAGWRESSVKTLCHQLFTYFRNIAGRLSATPTTENSVQQSSPSVNQTNERRVYSETLCRCVTEVSNITIMYNFGDVVII